MPGVTWTAEEIEFAMVREFWRPGEQHTSVLPRSAKRERIRLSILREKREREPFYDSGMTYMQAFHACYGIALELRKYPRENTPAHRVEDVDEWDET